MELAKEYQLKNTRTLLNAALSGKLANTEMRKDPNFGFSVPIKVDGINEQILDPKKTWQSESDYDAQAKKLVQMFISNFTKFESDVEENVKASGPIAN